MRRTRQTSPLPSDPAGKEDIMRPSPPHRAAATPATAPGNNGAVSSSAAVGLAGGGLLAEDHATRHSARSVLPGLAAQLAATLMVVTGLWVAISPWFLALQAPRAGNAAVSDLIIGLAVAAIGLLTVVSARGLAGLPAASLLAGIWLIISPFILAARLSITTSMYWSNIWAGAVVIAASLAVLTAGRARAAS